jgi:hypothetical protein
VAFLEATARKADFRMCKHDAVASALALFAISLTVGSLEARFHRGSQDAALADVELYLLGAVWVVNSLTCCCLLSRWRRMVGRVGREPQYVEEQASSCSWMIVELCANCISPLPGRNPNDTDGFDVHEAIALLVFARVYLFLRLACSVDELYRRRRLIRAELQARPLRLVPSVHSRAYKPATRHVNRRALHHDFDTLDSIRSAFKHNRATSNITYSMRARRCCQVSPRFDTLLCVKHALYRYGFRYCLATFVALLLVGSYFMCAVALSPALPAKSGTPSMHGFSVRICSADSGSAAERGGCTCIGCRYVVEREVQTHAICAGCWKDFSNVMWFCAGTMTTVGFGDMIPASTPGYAHSVSLTA